MPQAAHRLRTLLSAATLFVVSSGFAPASGQDIISAMAGFIHHTEGEVFLKDKPIEPKPTDFLHVQEGEHLRTAAGKAEIMLTPGSFVRLGPESEIEMISAGLTAARLRLVRGALILDLPEIFEKDSITILAGGDELHFPKPGLYRIESLDEPSRLKVFRGKAVALSPDGKQEVKGKEALDLPAGAGSAIVEKFDPKQKDSLDEWNEARTTTLAKAFRSASKGEADAGMDPAYRNWLEMSMRRPTNLPSQRMPSDNGPRQGGGGPSSGAGGGGGAGRGAGVGGGGKH